VSWICPHPENNYVAITRIHGLLPVIDP